MNAFIRLNIAKGKKNGLVALKLDISRAYNRVEWEFLRMTMGRLGFEENVVNLIMKCITSATFSVIINGVLQG